jgi:hypothetical protein
MPEILAANLLDPKNDYVFFRVFSEGPALLVDLINVVRSEEPAIIEVILLNLRLAQELEQHPMVGLALVLEEQIDRELGLAIGHPLGETLSRFRS